MGRLIEGFWDCPYCGRKRISGLERECSCGAERGEDVKFYMDGVHYIDDETAKTISKNPDWLCSYCGALVSDNDNTCHNCGASKSESEMNYFQNREKKEQREKEKQKEANEISRLEEHIDRIEEITETLSKERYDYYGIPHDRDAVNKKNNVSSTIKHILKWGLLVLALFAIVAGMFYLFTPKSVEGTIDGFEWNRSISVEEYRTVEESGWSIPSGGRLLFQQQEIKSYQQVLDHYETKTRTYTEQVLDHYETYVSGYRDNGNGTFTEITSQRPVYRTETKTETYQEPVYRSEPIYATKYYYEIDKWMHKEYVKTSGNDHNPYWGEYNYGDKEREGFKSADYYIFVTDEDGETHKYDVKLDLWETFTSGQRVKLKVDVFGHATLDLEEKDE